MLTSALLSIMLACFTSAHDHLVLPDHIQTTLKLGSIADHSAIHMFLRHHENVTYDDANVHAGLNCTDFNITDASNPLTQYLTYSGKSINDFGFFDNCKNIQTNPEMMAMSPPLYVLYEVSFFGYPAKWGVCMP